MDIFLEVPEDAQDLEQQVRALLFSDTSAAVLVATAQGSLYVQDYKFPDFLQRAYPVQKIPISEAYLSQMLHIGGQRCFQHNPSFMFYAYSWIMRKRVGTISYLASRSGHAVSNHSRTDPTIGEVRSLLEYMDGTHTEETGETTTTATISQASIRALVRNPANVSS